MGMKNCKLVIIVFLLNLILRLCFISWHPATYTDSIDYMTALERIRGTIILPAYPFALKTLSLLIGDLQLSGRLVSIVFASLAVFPLFGLARIIYGRRAAFFTVCFYTFSPLIFRWSLRIFPHGMYSFFVILFLFGIFRSFEAGSAWWLAIGIFSGGVAVLTYPTGLILVPVAAFAVYAYFLSVARRERSLRIGLGIFVAGWALLAAVFFILSPCRDSVVGAFDVLLGFFPVRLPGPPLAWHLIFLGAGWGLAILILSSICPAPNRRPGWWYRRPLACLSLGFSAGPYIFLHIWQRQLAMTTWYQQGMRTSMRSLAGRWEAWLKYYLVAYPYILVYPVAVLAGLGLILSLIRAVRRPLLRGWAAFFVYFFAAGFYTLVVNKWWTPRYLYMLAVAALPLAGGGIESLVAARRRALRSAGWIFFCLSLAASAVFSGLVLYWSRDSFGDIRRSAEYIRDHLRGERVFSSELRKVGFWSQTPLRGYTRRSRTRVRPGDLVLLVGWHTNLETELAYLNRFYLTEIVHKEKAEIVPLLADDIVDWAGKNLRRRANAPVVWEERFRKQQLESWLVEIKASRGEAEEKDVSAGKTAGLFSRSLLIPELEQATYFDVGVWEVLSPPEKGEFVRLEMAHPRAGPPGSFRMVAYADRDGDGLPDEKVAQSLLLESAAPGQWSSWEFNAPGGKLFVGSTWSLGNWVFHGRGSWPGDNFSEIMYYSRGGIPVHTAHRITNLKISFPNRGAEKH